MICYTIPTSRIPAELYDENSDVASVYAKANRGKFIAEMISCRTLPAGANPAKTFAPEGELSRNFNMNNEFQNGWPSERGNSKRWLHSDAREIACLYIHKLYEKLLS